MKSPLKKREPTYAYQTVILIDDNEIDNFINQKIIESSFFAKNVFVNTNGVSALEFLKNIISAQGASNEIKPAILFVDINMPFMDGLDFIRELTRLLKEATINYKPTIVVLTSSINMEDKEKVLQINKEIIYLNKPLTELALINLK